MPSLFYKLRIEMDMSTLTMYEKEGVSLQIDSDTEATISQVRTPGGKLYTQKELYDKARAVLPNHKIKAHVLYIELENVTPGWISGQMDTLGIKVRDLARQTGMNRSTLDALLSGAKPMSRTVRALFFYYFKVYELSKKIDDNGKEA